VTLLIDCLKATLCEIAVLVLLAKCPEPAKTHDQLNEIGTWQVAGSWLPPETVGATPQVPP
jgi:hypothetical protein